MSSHRTNHSNKSTYGAKNPLDELADAGDSHQHGVNNIGRGSAGSTRLAARSRRPVLRFVLIFVVLMLPFSIYFYGSLVYTTVFQQYLNINAAAVAQLLRFFGFEVDSAGSSINFAGGSLQIMYGCDAIFPTALFIAAVLSSPVSIRMKLPGLAIGSAVLLGLNLIRILTLYFTRVYVNDWFHTMHVDVWQPAYVMLALFFWVVWALWATKGGARDIAESLDT